MDMDLVVSSTLALDATHDVEWYVTDFVGSTFPTTFLFHVVVIRGRARHVRPCSGHAKRRKRQEHAGGRTCSRGDGERGARRIRRGGSTRHDIEMERAARKSLSTRRSGRRPR